MAKHSHSQSNTFEHILKYIILISESAAHMEIMEIAQVGSWQSNGLLQEIDVVFSFCIRTLWHFYNIIINMEHQL